MKNELAKLKKCVSRKFNENPVYKKYQEAQELVAKHTPSDYFKVYREHEVGYSREILKWIFTDHFNGGKVLDIGTAYGTFSVFAKQTLGMDVYAIDFVDNYAPKDLFSKMGINFQITNIETEDLPFNEKFDMIVLTEVLEHFNFNPIPTFIKIKNALAKNGVLYISTPNAKFWGRLNTYEKLSDIPCVNLKTPIQDQHNWHYNVAELISVINDAGLSIVDFDYAWDIPSEKSRRHFNLKIMRKEDVII